MPTPAPPAACPADTLTPGAEYIITHQIPGVQARPRESRLGFVRRDRGALIFTARGPGGRCDDRYGGEQAMEPGWIIAAEIVVRNDAARYVGRPAPRARS
jgi:hypothetical protein